MVWGGSDPSRQRHFALTPEHLLPEVVLRHLPSPRFWARLQRLLPAAVKQRLAQEILQSLVSGTLPPERLQFLNGRTLAIELVDMDWRLVLTAEAGVLRALPETTQAQASVQAETLDFLLLASQLEDADTLFFHRRLRMTGDTALGLQARNLMDQLPLDRLNPRLRVLLNHFTRLAVAAKAASHSGR